MGADFTTGDDEWVKVDLPLGCDAGETNKNRRTFCNLVGLRPGMLLRVKDVGVDDEEVALVGHINADRGRCDCCAMGDHTHVIAYRIAWRPDKGEKDYG